MRKGTQKRLEPYESWIALVNSLTRSTYHMTIYELEDDIPRERLKEAHRRGMTPQQVVDIEVRPVFYLDDGEPF